MIRRGRLRALLGDPAQRRKLMTGVIIATQSREGIVTTIEQAQAAYDAVRLKIANPGRDEPPPPHQSLDPNSST